MLESDGPGGAEIVTLQLSEELRRRGHEVVHVGPERGFGWLGDRFREAGFATETFSLSRPVDFRCLADLTAKLARWKADVIHSHEFTMCVYGAAAARRLGVPHVTTMHGNQEMTAKLRRRLALRWAFRNSRMAIACSDWTRRDVERSLGLKAHTVHAIRNGVPERSGLREPVRAELQLAPDAVLIVAVGNVVPRKGHLQLLQALARVEQERGPADWHVAIAGARRDAAASIDAFVAERNWSSRVHLLGPREDVPDLLAASDIFVMPSLWEGLPLALLEAMFAGKPIIASDVSGIPEAIASDRYGLLAPPGDVETLARHLDDVLRDPALRARLGAAARQRALDEFTVARMAERYLASYRGDRI
jgi:glycosyltransferase involved in cell wall biosynthesis